jgi:aryl-alcohol dehydrogenase-like predicted oxidoreductase
MQTRALGKDGPQVPVICLGAWPLGGGFGAVAEEQALATVRAALDAGMTFIDTAEGYRGSEALIGKAIKGRRDEVFLATKLSRKDHSAEHMDEAIGNSLKALGTDYIDLYQLHSPQPQWPIEQTMEKLLRMRDAGMIGHIGISNFSAEQTDEAARYGPVHSSQPRYNLLFRDAEESVLPSCLANGVGVIPHSVLAKGMLGGRYRPGQEFPPDDERHYWPQFHGEAFERTFKVTERLKQWAADHGRDIVQLAIAWPLAHPAVTSSIAGARTPEQARHNALAGDWTLTPRDLEEIDQIQGDLRLHFITPTQAPPVPAAPQTDG